MNICSFILSGFNVPVQHLLGVCSLSSWSPPSAFYHNHNDCTLDLLKLLGSYWESSLVHFRPFSLLTLPPVQWALHFSPPILFLLPFPPPYPDWIFWDKITVTSLQQLQLPSPSSFVVLTQKNPSRSWARLWPSLYLSLIS